MNILFLEHSPKDGPMNLAKWAAARGHAWSVARFYKGDRPTSYPDLLVILGGPMAAYDEAGHAWLVEEKRYIRDAVAEGGKILGICLGSQLLADALGARVKKHSTEEIGWLPIQLTDDGVADRFFADFPRELTVLQWHGDTWELPPGARLLAGSAKCAHQAFALGDRVLGIQFHLETGRDDLAIWMGGKRDETILGAPHFAELEKRMHQLLDRFD